MPEDCQPGDYWFDPATQCWLVCCPNGLYGNLCRHQVVEHDDHTITVSPSILVTYHHAGDGVQQYHGYLERGVWREA